MRDDVISLISIEIIYDEIGQPKEQEVSREVFCTVESVSQNEFYQASQAGMKPQFKITVSEFDYEGETKAEFRGKRYAIYRTYLCNDERIELYLQTKAGV